MPISSVLGSSALLPAGVGMRNLIINGDMRINQRASAYAISSTNWVYDRWKFQYTAVSSIGSEPSTDSPANEVFPGSIKVTAVSADTGWTTYTDASITHKIEGYNTAFLGWGTPNAKPVTLSFWVKSSLIGTYSVSFTNNAGDRVYVATYTINTAGTWEKKNITINGDSSGTWTKDNTTGISLRFWIDVPTSNEGTANEWRAVGGKGGTSQVGFGGTAGNTFFLTGVQLEQNYQPTPFEQRPIGVELALCQRYYEKSNGVTQVVAGSTGFGGNSYWNWNPYKVSKRLSLGYVTSDSANGVRIYNADGGANSINMWKGATGYYSNGIGFEVYTTEGFAIVTTGGQTDAGLGRYYWYANAEL